MFEHLTCHSSFQLTAYVMKQVPLAASHPIPNQLLTFHAILWLYIRYHGQIYRLSIWKLTPTEGGRTWCGASHSSHNTRIHLSSPPGIRMLGFWTSEIQVVFVVNVARHSLVHDGHLDLRAHIHCWEECLQTPKTANMGYSQIQHSSKDYTDSADSYVVIQNEVFWHSFHVPAVLHAMAERTNK